MLRANLVFAIAGAFVGGNAHADHQVGEAAPTQVDPNCAPLRGAARPGEAGACDVGEQILPPPPTYRANGVQIDEHLGATLPLDAAFRTQDGTVVTLGSVLRPSRDESLPTILTFNYADCPLLCSMQLTGLTSSMPTVADPKTGVALHVGGQYRIVTISLEPNVTLEKLGKMRERYLAKLIENSHLTGAAADAQRAAAERGWTYLAPAVAGDDTQIRRVADVVGFKYNYVPERAEWAHPAAFIFVDSRGKITRYAHGFEIEPAVLRESIVKAGLSEPATAAGFMHLCYFWDPDASNHSHAGMMALRIGAAGAVVLLAAGIGLMAILRRTSWNRNGNEHPSRRVKSSEEAS